jgi:hypothetical protein
VDLLEFGAKVGGDAEVVIEPERGVGVRQRGRCHINYLRRKVDTGYDRPLIRTVRGTGYQIGTNGFVS